MYSKLMFGLFRPFTFVFAALLFAGYHTVQHGIPARIQDVLGLSQQIVEVAPRNQAEMHALLMRIKNEAGLAERLAQVKNIEGNSAGSVGVHEQMLTNVEKIYGRRYDKETLHIFTKLSNDIKNERVRIAGVGLGTNLAAQKFMNQMIDFVSAVPGWANVMLGHSTDPVMVAGLESR